MIDRVENNLSITPMRLLADIARDTGPMPDRLVKSMQAE
jgi:hypothetical protein